MSEHNRKFLRFERRISIPVNGVLVALNHIKVLNNQMNMRFIDNNIKSRKSNGRQN